MDGIREEIDFRGRVALYRNFDNARHEDLNRLADEHAQMKEKLLILEADLLDEKEHKQSWRRRAQEAEFSIRRNQFILVLIDGDGYIFKERYLRDASESGGAKAAHDIATEVQEYLRKNNIIDPSSQEMQVMVNIYANRGGLAKALYDAEMIQMQSQLDHFFQSFNQSRPLFQFIDCGYGKERADAKLRDTYRFFAYDAHCKHIFLACCHDNGYVAELDRYRHDPIAQSKTILVQSAQMGRGYINLDFPIAQLDVFHTQQLASMRKETVLPIAPPMAKQPSLSTADDVVSQANAETPQTTAPTMWSTITGSTSTTTPSATTKKPAQSTTPSTAVAAPSKPIQPQSPQLEHGEPQTVAPNKGIPVNRLDQRIDLKIPAPTSAELDAFERRIAKRKLCNRFHLSKTCQTYGCHFDHDPIDAKMKNTLRNKARSIPCAEGTDCRDAKCFYGHHCPWGGRAYCTNFKCTFEQKGLHGVSDLDVVKYVPAETYYY